MSAARSLADDLRRRGDDGVAELLRLRPDLAHPVPRSFADLAVRANSDASAVAALADLTAAELDVLEAACALAPAGRFGLDDLAAGLGRPGDDAVSRACAALFRRALLWGPPDDIRIPSAVRGAVGRHPCGLDPRPTALHGDPARAAAQAASLRSQLDRAPKDVAAVVRRLAWGPPRVAPAADRGEAQAIHWLLERDLLVRDEADQLWLPRETALALRDGRLLAAPRLDPPAADPPQQRRGSAAEYGHAADQILRALDRVVAHTADNLLTRQANGSVRTRERDAAAEAAGVDAGQAALMIAVAWHLLWLDDDGSGRLRPTTVYEAALADPREVRWARAVVAWLDLPYTPSSAAVPRPPDPGDVPRSRRLVLRAAAEVAAEDVPDWLAWFRPRWDISASEVAAVFLEAQQWGLLTRSGLLPAARSIVIDPPPDIEPLLAAAVVPLLPDLATGFILQADLTATALGPLPVDVERHLLRMASWESGGAGSVFRFTPQSVRRALALGEDPDEVLNWLAAHSRTPVPQALEVLLADSARARSRMSVSAAAAVLRCDDAVADVLRADPALAGTGLQRLAPGVYAAAVPPDELARRLRAAGHQVDSEEGAAAAVIAQKRRSPGEAELTATPERIVRSLRRVEERAHPEQHPPRELAPVVGDGLRSLLESLCEEHRQVWLRFADDNGRATTRLIEPLGLSGGEICAFDLTGSEIRMIPMSRVTAAAVPH